MKKGARTEEIAAKASYGNQIAFAQREWADGNIAAAWEHLDACRWDLRGWEHDYLCACMRRRFRRLFGHYSWVRRLVISPDGTLLASGSADGTVKVWNVATGKEVCSFRACEEWRMVLDVAFSDDGGRVVALQSDGMLREFDIRTKRQASSRRIVETDIRPGLLLQNGRRVIAVADTSDTNVPDDVDMCHIVDLDNGRRGVIAGKRPGVVTSLAVSPDGTWIVAGTSEKKAYIWDAETSEERLAFETPRQCIAFAVSPDGKRIAGADAAGYVTVWTASTGKTIIVWRGSSFGIGAVAFSSDGEWILTGSRDRGTRLWNSRTGEPITTLRGHTGSVDSLAISRDGRLVITGSVDNTVGIWQIDEGEDGQILEGPGGSVTSIAFSPDGRLLATGHREKIASIWDVQSGKVVRTLRGHARAVRSLAFNSDGRQLAHRIAGRHGEGVGYRIRQPSAKSGGNIDLP